MFIGAFRERIDNALDRCGLHCVMAQHGARGLFTIRKWPNIRTRLNYVFHCVKKKKLIFDSHKFSPSVVMAGFCRIELRVNRYGRGR